MPIARRFTRGHLTERVHWLSTQETRSMQDALISFYSALAITPPNHLVISEIFAGTRSLLNPDLQVESGDLPDNRFTAFQAPLLETEILIQALWDQFEGH